ncbi:hypothetical protein FRAHR75_60088 [Frankia sp. Hr75.2]|nr:hypothetical protein FRAHR75_60088 [Frankia sp. Hr75.2]
MSLAGYLHDRKLVLCLNAVLYTRAYGTISVSVEAFEDPPPRGHSSWSRA